MSKNTSNKTEANFQKVVKQEIRQLEVGMPVNKFGKEGTVIWMGIQNDVTNVKVRWKDDSVEFFLEKDLQ